MTKPKQDLETLFFEAAEKSNDQYLLSHLPRYKETVSLLRDINWSSAFEIGATHFFQAFLAHARGPARIDAAIFDFPPGAGLTECLFSFAGKTQTSRSFRVDIESEFVPAADETYDLVLMLEVLEHLDVDPMAAMMEVNRVLQIGGNLVLSTPNICSTSNLYKIMKGYRPHFFMQYEKSRSPYRHNIEYDVHLLAELVSDAGFEIIRLFTKDVFRQPTASQLSSLNRHGVSAENRGDDIFVLATKRRGVQNRWPSSLYV